MIDIVDELLLLKQKIRTLEQNTQIRGVTFPSDGYLIIPVVTADPASPVRGQVWYNSTSNLYKCYDGAIKTFTVT